MNMTWTVRHSLGRLRCQQLSDDDWGIASIGLARWQVLGPAVLLVARVLQLRVSSSASGFDGYDLDGDPHASHDRHRVAHLSLQFVTNGAGVVQLFWYTFPEKPVCPTYPAPRSCRVTCLIVVVSRIAYLVAHLKTLNLHSLRPGAWISALPDSLESHFVVCGCLFGDQCYQLHSLQPGP